MYFVGIDIAKRFHEAAVINEQGKIIIKRIKFQNSHAGYCKLMEAVRKLNQPVEFAMEATGHYRLSLYAHLRQSDRASDKSAAVRCFTFLSMKPKLMRLTLS